jgi:hypothetical protein
MAELRISDLCGQPGGGYGWSWRAERELPREAEVEFDDPSDEGDEERVRWYLEDYAEFPADPVPALAREAEVPDRAAPLGCVRGRMCWVHVGKRRSTAAWPSQDWGSSCRLESGAMNCGS